jgi:hypothetical protein
LPLEDHEVNAIKAQEILLNRDKQDLRSLRFIRKAILNMVEYELNEIGINWKIK